MKCIFYRYSILALLLCCLAGDCLATHLRAAEIQVERLNCNALTFQIKVIVYLDTKSRTPVGGSNVQDGNVSFGDGSMVLIPETAGIFRPDLGTDIAIATFITVHTYLSPGIYKINYYERDRSAGVLNMDDSDDTAYSSSITINIDALTGCNQYPRLSIPPVDKACSGISFFHNAGAYDPDGDSLSYALTIPEQNIDLDVNGYVNVDAPKFYLNYDTGNETGTGPPQFSIDPVTGLITWDAPGMQGEYNIAFEIIEWRRLESTGEFVRLSTTVRDMQIIVSECDNVRPNLTMPKDICVEAGTSVHARMTGSDPEFDSVKIEVFSEVFGFAVSRATVTPSAVKFVPSFPSASIEFDWTTDCLHVREQPYQIVFKITDKPQLGITLTTFKTWNIRVIAPRPVWKAATLDVANHSARLEWNDYVCNNASGMQIWRKVDDIGYSPGACDTGIPAFLGYELIATIDPALKTFIDTNYGDGLAAGAKYCYRLVAVFNPPSGGKSYVSDEVCVGPIVAEAPIITHVSVTKTDDTDGAIRVSWRSPIAINTSQFPKPYQYKVFRADGFSGDENLMQVSDLISDTTLLNDGLKTSLQAYNYRVVVYTKFQNSATYQPFDTSSIASSVWLGTSSGIKKIELTWNAIVPWSNVVEDSPWHLIYRGIQGDNELVLIDSVNVSLTGFGYVDEGRYKNMPLDDNTMYCYGVMTRGTYGNAKIAISKNFSQQVCLYPVTKLLPCKPQVSVALTDCEQFIKEKTCENMNFENDVSWEPDLRTGCRLDIVSYDLYASNNAEGEFLLVASNVQNVTFVDGGLPSYARCYRLTAEDSHGNVSELSDPVCNDNCPYFDLPNVFTPNGDGCNDRFSAYQPEDEATCNTDASSRCPQFVEQVSFTVFNRWGNSVYKFNSGDGKSVNIDWDGRDDSGTLLDAAVYYYNADVTFTTSDPLKRNKTIRGWVQLVR